MVFLCHEQSIPEVKRKELVGEFVKELNRIKS